MTPTSRARCATVLAAVVLLAGCGTEQPGRPGASGSPTRSPTTSATPTPRTALHDLAPFLAAARATDARLRAAATRINGSVGAATITFDTATVDAVKAVDAGAVSATIPAGLDRSLLRAALLVYSDLVSRHLAMARVRIGSFGRGTADGIDILRCLTNGHAAALRFAADVRALETRAARSAPVTQISPQSRAAAELAVRATDIRLANAGCDTCGGVVRTDLMPITWNPGHTATRYKGEIGHIDFVVTYRSGDGWVAQLNAC